MRENIKNCVMCGKPIDQKEHGQARKYCPECAVIARRQQAAERRKREAQAREVLKAAKVQEKPSEGVTRCTGCIYWRGLHASRGIKCCNYCIDTGILRGIPAAECYKHAGTPYTPKGRKNAEV